MTEQAMGTVDLTPSPSTENAGDETATEEVAEETTDDADVSRETPIDADSSDDSDDAGSSSHGKKKAAAEEAEEEGKEKKKLKRKVDGKMVEVTEDELWKHYGKEKAATKKTMEAAEIRKEAEKIKADAETTLEQINGLFEKMKENPDLLFELAERLGHDPKQLARKKTLEELEYERMDPKDREILELRKKAEKADQLEAAQKEESVKRAAAQKKAHFTSSVDNLMAETFKLSGLQPKRITIARMAEACQTLINASKTPGELPTAQQVLEKFLGYSRQDLSEMVGEQDIETLHKLGLISDNFVEQTVKWHLAKNKANLPSFGNKQNANVKKPATTTTKKTQTIEQFFKNIGSQN